MSEDKKRYWVYTAVYEGSEPGVHYYKRGLHVGSVVELYEKLAQLKRLCIPISVSEITAEEWNEAVENGII